MRWVINITRPGLNTECGVISIILNIGNASFTSSRYIDSLCMLTTRFGYISNTKEDVRSHPPIDPRKRMHASTVLKGWMVKCVPEEEEIDLICERV